MKLESFDFTFIGGREENQDSVGYAEVNDRGIYIVADGLGGHQHGSLASQHTVTALMRAWKENPDWDRDRLFESVKTANEAVLEISQAVHTTAKSTVALLTVTGDKALCANTGDSRVYYFRDGEVRPVTEDHSVAYKKYKAGEITKAEIAQDEDQSSLLRALGGERRWEPDAYEIDSLKQGDAFLLCSDGFWEYISDEEMLVDRLKAETAREWANLMLLRVMNRIPEDNDNLSLITVMLQ